MDAKQPVGTVSLSPTTRLQETHDDQGKEINPIA